MKLKPDVLAAKYIAQLEQDLKLERKRLDDARRDLEFYRGKCERLELAIMNNQTGSPAGGDYVRRTEPRKPSIGSVKLGESMRPMFSELRKKWAAMTAEEQEKAVASGSWQVPVEEKESEVLP